MAAPSSAGRRLIEPLRKAWDWLDRVWPRAVPREQRRGGPRRRKSIEVP